MVSLVSRGPAPLLLGTSIARTRILVRGKSDNEEDDMDVKDEKKDKIEKKNDKKDKKKDKKDKKKEMKNKKEDEMKKDKDKINKESILEYILEERQKEEMNTISSIPLTNSVSGMQADLFAMQRLVLQDALSAHNDDRDRWHQREAQLQDQIRHLTDEIATLAKIALQSSTASTISTSPPLAPTSVPTAATTTPSSPTYTSRPPTPTSTTRTTATHDSSSTSSDLHRALSALDAGMDVLSPAFDDMLITKKTTTTTTPATPTTTSTSVTPASTPTPAVSTASTPLGVEDLGLGALPAGTVTPDGPPPLMKEGDDDIFWMHQLHSALAAAGYYVVDEDLEFWMFGESTTSCVMTFQACSKLPETGIVDEAEWRLLLGDDLVPKKWGASESSDPVLDAMDKVIDQGAISTTGTSTTAAAAATPAAPSLDPSIPVDRVSAADTFFYTFGNGGMETETETETFTTRRSATSNSITSSTRWNPKEESTRDDHLDDAAIACAKELSSKDLAHVWPVLREGDGGVLVLKLQLLLRHAGFYPDDDDTRWWQYGDSTVEAVKFFQACSSLPETGTVAEPTWRALLQADGMSDYDTVNAEVILQVEARNEDEESFETDLAAMNDPNHERVFLMGEQRWELRHKS